MCAALTEIVILEWSSSTAAILFIGQEIYIEDSNLISDIHYSSLNGTFF